MQKYSTVHSSINACRYISERVSGRQSIKAITCSKDVLTHLNRTNANALPGEGARREGGALGGVASAVGLELAASVSEAVVETETGPVAIGVREGDDSEDEEQGLVSPTRSPLHEVARGWQR